MPQPGEVLEFAGLVWQKRNRQTIELTVEPVSGVPRQELLTVGIHSAEMDRVDRVGPDRLAKQRRDARNRGFSRLGQRDSGIGKLKQTERGQKPMVQSVE